MKKVFIFLGIIVGMVAFPAGADIVHVPGDYPTIQQGIDVCTEGDTVMVADGVYTENLNIGTPISLIGQNRDGTIVDGNFSGDVIFVETGYVNIRNLTVRNSGDDFEDAGIEIAVADNCEIEYCRVEDNYAGLSLYSSSHCVIARCLFITNYNGIVFRESYSGPISDNLSNQITNCIVTDNSEYGIIFEHTGGTYHNSNLVAGNRILLNPVGISTIMSRDNQFIFNSISENTGYGAAHAMCMGGGENNQFHHNNFISNHGGLNQASDVGGGVDYWYCTEACQGNFWSDYTGPDNNGDGIGDTPYAVDGDESQDIYPLMVGLSSTIRGYVSDGLEPIEGVHVTAYDTGIEDYTDPSGLFELSGLGAGMYDILFSHPMFADTSVVGVPATLGQITDMMVVMEVQVSADDDPINKPGEFVLAQNYPNPFNARTTIEYNLPFTAVVVVEVFDILGNKIEILIDRTQSPGKHRIVWKAEGIPSGIYFYRIESGEYSLTRRMILLK